MRQQSFIISLLASVAVAGPPGIASAHDGPNQDVQRLTRALAEMGERADLLIERGLAYRLHGQPAAAIGDFDRAQKLHGDCSVIAYERALCLIALGRVIEAEEQLDAHLAGPHPTPAGFARRAEIRHSEGHCELAAEDYMAAILLNPDVQTIRDYGRLLEDMGRLDDAATAYRNGLTQCGGAVVLRLELIRLEISTGRFENAVSLIDEAMSQAEVKTDWYLRRAEVRALQGDLADSQSDRESALAEASRVLRRKRTSVHLLGSARALAALGRNKDALIHARKALSLAPADQETLDLIASLTN